MPVTGKHVGGALQAFTIFVFLAAVFFSFISIENNYSDKFQHCISYYANREAGYYRIHKYSVVEEVFDTQAVCTVAAIDRHNGFFALILSAALVGFTFALSRSTTRMMKVTDAQGESAAKSIKEAGRAATAMEGVAAAMVANVENARIITDRQKLQMRAHVFPHAGNLICGLSAKPPLPKRANEPFLALEIKNSGPTPAYEVSSWAQIEIIEPSREDTLVVPIKLEKNKFGLGGYQSFPKNIWLGRDLNQSEIDDLKAGVKRIYYYGRVEYMSLGERHTTNFRLFYQGNFPLDLPIGLSFAENGNDAD